MIASTLDRLARWYASRCDGEWEHGFGVRIDTLDNPGWSVKINLEGTPLAERPFEKIVEGEEDENYADGGKQIGPWMTCFVKQKVWHAVCDPSQLDRALTRFLDWADA